MDASSWELLVKSTAADWQSAIQQTILLLRRNLEQFEHVVPWVIDSTLSHIRFR
jgi:hypothetical protein